MVTLQGRPESLDNGICAWTYLALETPCGHCKLIIVWPHIRPPLDGFSNPKQVYSYLNSTLVNRPTPKKASSGSLCLIDTQRECLKRRFLRRSSGVETFWQRQARWMQILFTIGRFINIYICIYITFLQSTIHSNYKCCLLRPLWGEGVKGPGRFGDSAKW